MLEEMERTRVNRCCIAFILKSDNKYPKCYRFILNNELAPDRNLFSFIGLSTKGDAIAAAKNLHRDAALELYRYVANDKAQFYDLLKRQYNGIGFIMAGRDRKSVKILDMALDSKCFSKRQLMGLLSIEYG